VALRVNKKEHGRSESLKEGRPCSLKTQFRRRVPVRGDRTLEVYSSAQSGGSTECRSLPNNQRHLIGVARFKLSSQDRYAR
jgi:hypothetical protein